MPASVKIVSQGDTISEFEYFAVGFPNGNINRVAAVKHSASRGNVYAVHRHKAEPCSAVKGLIIRASSAVKGL